MKLADKMGTASIPRLLISFSTPAIVGTLVHATYNVVDRIFLGNAVGPVGIAATTVSHPIMLIGMAFGMLVGHGGNTLVSIHLGENRQDDAEAILGQAIMLFGIVSLILTVAGLTFIRPLLRAFGATPTILPAAVEYMRIILAGMIVHQISFGLNNFIRGEGNPRVAMLTILLGAGLNIVLDAVFILGFGWGLRGAALATVIAHAISAGWVLHYFFGGRSQLRVKAINLRPAWKRIRRIAEVGSPPFAMQLAGSLLMIIANNQLRHYGGDLAISAMGVVLACLAVFFMPIIGICMGMQPIVGYNYGAGHYDRVRHTVLLALGFATGTCVLVWILVQAMPGTIVSLFGRNEDDLIEMGSFALRSFLFVAPIIGLQIVGSQYFQAIGKPRMAMFLTLSRQLIVIAPLLLILPRFYGLNGIWFAGPIADLVSVGLTIFFLGRELRRLNQLGAAAEEPT